MFLQRTAGNQAVQRLIKSGVLQAKLKIGQPNDIYEQEADRVAEQVMMTPDPQTVSSGTLSIQRTCPGCEEEKLRRQPIEEEEEKGELLQTKGISGQNAETTQDLESRINAIRGGGQPLAESERAFFEPRFGYDLGKVRVHTDSKAAEAARAVNARAFTTGHDITFGAGQYSPGTTEGKRLLTHELTHVIQQNPTRSKRSRSVSGSGSKESIDHLQRAVRSVSCQNPSGRVRDIVGDNPLGTVQAADTRAIELLDNAIRELVNAQEQIRGGGHPAWPLTSDVVGVALRERFGMNPENREMWVSRQRFTPRGVPTISLLIFRLERTREVLAGGRIQYRCLDRPPCPPMSKPDEFVIGPNAFADPAGITYLCEGFWRDLPREPDGQALVLVHEAFHVYFVGIDRGRNMWNAHCIANFVADVNGITISEDREGCCAPGANCEY